MLVFAKLFGGGFQLWFLSSCLFLFIPPSIEDYVFSDSFSRNFSFEVFILGRVVVLEFDQAIWLHVVGDLYVVCLDSKF